MVTKDTITPEMLRALRADAVAHPGRYPNYRDPVIRYATWALGETADFACVDCSLLGRDLEHLRPIALEESARTWNWRETEDAKASVIEVPRLRPEKLRLLQWLSDRSTMLDGSAEARIVLDEVIAAYRSTTGQGQ